MSFIFEVHTFNKVDSTIECAKDYIVNRYLDSNKIVAFIADEQTLGQGKQGRTWHSPKGNLYLTSVLSDISNYNFDIIKDINIFNLLISVAVIKTLKICLSKDCNITCKWPNDVLVNNSKISGILLEKTTSKQNKTLLLASIGVNIVSSPKLDNYRTTSINEVCDSLGALTNLDFVALLLKNITLYHNISHTKIIQEWLSYAHNLDKEITIKINNIIETGIFKGITNHGLLMLEIDNNLVEVSCGEIY